jgi:DNA-binding response OmpR family regulator
MARILVVEDDAKMRTGLRDNLEFEGYDVEVVADGKSGLDKAQQGEFDLLLLDVMLPQLSGFDVLKSLREHGNRTPAIMLTAKGEEIDKVLGLELGADDYVTKPFGVRELMARVKAVLRRHTQTDETESVEQAKIGNLEVNFASYSASKGGKPVPMTPKEIKHPHGRQFHPQTPPEDRTRSRQPASHHYHPRRGVQDACLTTFYNS